MKQEQQPKMETNEDNYATCNGCGIGMAVAEIKYTSADGSDYCNDCYEAIQGDDESSGRLHNVFNTIRLAALNEIELCNYSIQEDSAFVKGAEFGAAWQKEHSYSEQEQWVSVKDRLPELGIKVLVYFGEIDNVLMAIPKCNNKYETVFCVYYADRFTNDHTELITHWMPLPAPPKQ